MDAGLIHEVVKLENKLFLAKSLMEKESDLKNKDGLKAKVIVLTSQIMEIRSKLKRNENEVC